MAYTITQPGGAESDLENLWFDTPVSLEADAVTGATYLHEILDQTPGCGATLDDANLQTASLEATGLGSVRVRVTTTSNGAATKQTKVLRFTSTDAGDLVSDLVPPALFESPGEAPETSGRGYADPVDRLFAEVRGDANLVVHTDDAELVPYKINVITGGDAFTLPPLGARTDHGRFISVINETGGNVTITSDGADQISGGSTATTYVLGTVPGVVTLIDRAAVKWTVSPRL